jgi:hypothetical protein
MDIISHGLWGSVAAGRKSKKSFWTAFVFGVGPDLLSFGIFFGAGVLGLSHRPDWEAGPPDPQLIPRYVHSLYDLTHSLVIFAVVFALVWLVRKKPLWEMSGWGLHVLMDIPSHSSRFFPTPFLYPVSDFTINGISWAQPVIFIPNVAGLVVAYLLFLWSWRKRKKSAQETKETK